MNEWTPLNSVNNEVIAFPPEYKLVLLAFPKNEFQPGSAPATAVGYLRFAAGDINSPSFVTPGIGGNPSHWCDCLPDNFSEMHPHWKFPK